MRHHSWSICTYTLLETCSTFKHLFVWHASNAVYCLVHLPWIDYFLGCIEKQVDFHHINHLTEAAHIQEGMFVLASWRSTHLLHFSSWLRETNVAGLQEVEHVWLSKPTIFPIVLAIRYTSRFVRGLVACRIKVKAYNSVHKQDQCLDTCHCLDWQCFRS